MLSCPVKIRKNCYDAYARLFESWALIRLNNNTLLFTCLYLIKCFSLGVDNYYTSYELFLYLVQNKTHCRTVHSTRHGFPKEVLKKKWKKSEWGKLIRKYSKKLLLINWANKEDVRILGSIEKASNDHDKPELVHLYIKAIPGADLADQY
jgi:hypothetical protein